MNLSKVVVVLMLISPFSSFAEDNFCMSGKPHPIDVWLNKELSKTNGVTVNIRNAQSEAYQKWDEELNRVYKKIRSLLNEGDKSLLRDSQRLWVSFRDAEIKLLWSKSMFGQGGSSAPIFVSDLGREIVKKRVCELSKYTKIIEDPFY